MALLFISSLIVSLVVLSGIILIVYFLFKRLGKLYKIDPNASIILNFLNSKSNGYFMGVELDSVKGVEGREKLVYYPADTKKSELTEKEEKTILQDIIADKNHLFIFAPGELSKRRVIKIILPKNEDELNAKFLTTPLGVGFTKAIQIKNFESDVIKALREGGEARAKWLIAHKQGEISSEEMERIKRIGYSIIEKEYGEKLKD